MSTPKPFSVDAIAAEDWASTPSSVSQLVDSLFAKVKQTEALLAGESRLIQFLEATPIGIAVHNATGQLVYLNLVGKTLLGIDFTPDVPPEDLATQLKIYRATNQELYPVNDLPSSRALSGEAAHADDLELHRCDRVIALEVWATPILDDQGNVLYSVAAFQDVSDRKRRELEQQILENTLQTREDRYRQLIQMQTDLILRSRPDTTVTFANEALCQALGQPLEHVMGQQWCNFVPPEDVELLQRKIANLTPEQPTFENINRDYRADHQIGWTQWINLGIFDAAGTLVEIQSVGRDVTALQEKILQEQALNRIFQAIHHSLDLDTIFATATTAMAQLIDQIDCFVVQYQPERGIWQHVAEFREQPDAPSTIGLEIPDAGNPFAAQLKQFQLVKVEDATTLEDQVNQALAETVPGAWLLIPLVVDNRLWGSFSLIAIERYWRWPTEQVELAEAVAKQLEVAIHQANLYQQVQLELAERRRIEMALRESEMRFQNMAANVPGAIFRYVLRPDGSDGVLYMSPGCDQLWEVEAAAVVADASLLWSMVHPDDQLAMQQSVMTSAQTLAPWSWAWRILTPSGQEKWLEAAGRPTRQANGDIIWDTLILDVTDRKRAEQRLQTLAANLPGVIYQYVLRADGTDAMLYVSPGCRDLWELEPVAIEADVAATWRMVHPADLAAMRASVQMSAQTLEPWNYEWRIVLPAGRLKWLQASARPQRQANGDVVWDGLIFDVSDRKQAEEALERSEQRFRKLFESTPKIAVQGYNRHREVIYWNEASTELYGYTQAEALGQKLEDLIIPTEMREAVIEAIQTWLTDGVVIPAEELELRHKNGSAIAVYSSHMMLINPEGEPEMYCVDVDVSDRKKAEAAMRDSEARYRLVAENMNDLVCLHDIQGRYLYVSPSCEVLLGYQPEDLLGQDPNTYIHPDDRERVAQETQMAATTGQVTPITYRMRQRSGAYIWFETLAKPIVDSQGQITQLQTTSRNVTERVQVQQQLRHEALHDALTGLPNRTLLMQRLELSVSRAKRLKNYQFAVLFFDLDRFKVINDSLGHVAGDQLLIRVAQTLRSTVREIDLVVRLGGDEFVILLEDIEGIEDAILTVERIFAVLQQPVDIQGRDVYTTASAGIVLGTREYTQAADLLRDADIAMYRAKRRNHAQYDVFDAQMYAEALHRLHTENDLRRAIMREEFVLYYQPILALDSGAVVGFETLIRWQHPTDGLKLPGAFVAIAEETGLITAIDYWAIATACQQLAAWQATWPAMRDMKVHVNLSVQDLHRSDLLTYVAQVLDQTGLPAHCLTLEITESMLIQDVEAMIQLLAQFKQRGIQISIDDFGTGYSSLNYLHRLPVDSLKVDRSFVGQMHINHRNYQIVETIGALSHQLELDTVAEGIETQSQLDQLRQIGYKFGQGYFFSKPLPVAAIESFIVNQLRG